MQHSIPIYESHTNRRPGIQPRRRQTRRSDQRPGRRVRRSSNKNRPRGLSVMKETNTRTGATNPAGSAFDMSKTATPQALRQFAENGAAQARESYEKMSAATAEASNLIQTSCTTAAKGAAEYNAKLIEIACANANASF